MHPTSRVIDQFHDIAKACRLDYMIIGGYAASFWGTPRFTADLDYVVVDSQLGLVNEVMAKLNYELVFQHPRDSFAHFKASTSSAAFRIDFMFVNADTWAKLKSASSLGDFGGAEPYPVVGPIHLIAMKLHAASQSDRLEYLKDLQDIVAIMQRQNISYETLDKEGILTKYGKREIIEKLKLQWDEFRVGPKQ